MRGPSCSSSADSGKRTGSAFAPPVIRLALALFTTGSLAIALPPALPERGFSYGLTGGLEMARDDLLVPLRWDCGMLELALGFAARSGPVRHEAQVSIAPAYGVNRFGHEAVPLVVRGEYRLAATGGLALAGGRLTPGGFAFYRCQNAYLVSWDDSHLYWMNGIGLGPAAQWRGRVAGRLDAVADLAFALFALAARPAADRENKVEPLDQLSFYFADNWRGLEFCLPDRYTAVAAAAGLEWRAGQSRMAAGYALDLLRVSWPALGVSLLHGLWLRWSPGAAR
jgi:hypothetical protein